MPIPANQLSRSPWQRLGAWALLLGAMCGVALPARAAPSETVSSPEDAPREVRLAALAPASVHVRLLSGTRPQVEAVRDERSSPGERIIGEVLGGILGQSALVLPSGFVGAELNRGMADTSACNGFGQPRRAHCEEDITSSAWGLGFLLGMNGGLALGSGLGVWLAGELGQGGGHGWMALLGSSLAALGTGLVFLGQPPEQKTFAVAMAFPLTLIGAILLYELSIPPPAAAPAAERAPVRITPSVAWVPGGGVVGLSGRF